MLSTNSNSNNRRKPKNGIDYLKAEHLSTTPRLAKILGVKDDPNGKFGPGMILKVAIEGTLYFWTVTQRNPNHKVLISKFGVKENDFVGQEFLIGLEKDEFTENYLPTVTFPSKSRK